MKRGFFLALFLFSRLLFAQNELPYNIGEYSSFEVSFRGIIVGSAEMEIVENTLVEGTSAFHIVGKGRTTPFFDWFFKVRDVYETYLDTLKILPIKFIRSIHEGGYEKQQVYNFSHLEGIALTADSAYKIADNSQDMLSAFFYARTFSKEYLMKNKSFFVPMFMDEENFLLEVVFLERDTLETKWGAIDCMVFKPKMQEGRVFEEEEEMKIWITDDANHLLMKVEAKIWSGKIKANLINYKKLKYPLSIIKQE